MFGLIISINSRRDLLNQCKFVNDWLRTFVTFFPGRKYFYRLSCDRVKAASREQMSSTEHLINRWNEYVISRAPLIRAACYSKR